MPQTLVLSANAASQRGGQGLNLYHMVNGLRGYFDVRLFCRESFPGLQTEIVPPSTLSSSIGRVPILRRLRDLQNRWSDVHFDHYVSRRLTPAKLFQGVSGQCHRSLAKAKELGCRTVLDSITAHIDVLFEHQNRECARFNVRPAIDQASHQRMQQEYQRADLIRVMSEQSKGTFEERGFTNVVVVHPHMEVSEFPEAMFQEPKFRVSFVGLLEPWKGFHYLVDAFNSLDLPDSELILWGSSGSRPVAHYLRREMSRNPRIQLRPVVVRSCYGDVYAKSSVLVHPSLSDGFGYVVGEAMASGIPVIVTRNTGAADLVVDGKNGYVVPVCNSEAIRERLAHLAAHPALLKEMGRQARETMRSRNGDEWRTYAVALERLAS
jgi:glycosyltransferase involved in cell wall biosynthesis